MRNDLIRFAKGLGNKWRFGKEASPLEDKILNAFLEFGFRPEWEHPVGYYLLDFAFPKIKLGIELDSDKYHSSEEQKTKDEIKTNYLRDKGWKIERLAGWVCWRHPEAVVARLLLRYFNKELSSEQKKRCNGALATYLVKTGADPKVVAHFVESVNNEDATT